MSLLKSKMIVFVLVAFFLSGIIVPLAESLDKQRVDKLISEAKKEGKMVYYSTQTAPDSLEYLRNFEKKYPFIKTTLYRAGTGGLLSKIMMESQMGKYEADVIQIGGFEAQVLKDRGLTAKYMSPEAAFFPEGFKDPEGFWCDVFVNIGIMVYNTKLVAKQDAPKSYADLLDPKWKGKKISMDQEDVEWFGNMMEIMGKEKGMNFMKTLAAQEPVFRRGRRLQAQLLTAGEFPIGLNLYIDSVAEYMAQGAPIEPVATAEPRIAKLHPISVAAHAPHPNAAKLYIDFILSEEGQKLVAKTAAPSRKGVFSENPDVRKFQELKLHPSAPELGKKYKNYRALFEETFKRK